MPVKGPDGRAGPQARAESQGKALGQDGRYWGARGRSEASVTHWASGRLRRMKELTWESRGCGLQPEASGDVILNQGVSRKEREYLRS